MKDFTELNLGFYDAQNYLLRENKKLFDEIFYKDETLNKLLESSRYFLVGEKGTGKTAYSVFLSNKTYKNTKSTVKYITETDYKRFTVLMAENLLKFSDYQTIWKTILLLLVLKNITKEMLKNTLFEKRKLFNEINKVIDEYYDNAFTPEIESAITVIEESELRANLSFKENTFGGTHKSSNNTQKPRLTSELMVLLRNFEKALSNLKLEENFTLYIDGIDIRPGDISFPDYLECIKGLADATWTLNNNFFSSIKDSIGRVKVVLLLRPDIFNSINMQNSANKIRDNAVVLDWVTNYPEHRESDIFSLVDRLLSAQQDKDLLLGEAWDYYFPWSNQSFVNEAGENSFISFLRYSYSRPRDIIAALQIIQEHFKKNKKIDYSIEHFFQSNQFKKQYSEFMLDSIKNQTAFYYSEDDYNTFITFFDYLHRPRFSWDEYVAIYQKYTKNSVITDFPVFMATDKEFLQFLYDSNIICYIEEFEYQPLYRWCYKERKIAKMSPKVKIGVNYAVHEGLWKSLSLGWQKKKEI